MRHYNYLLLFFMLLCSKDFSAQSLSPLSFGLREAKNGIQRYEVLRDCHIKAFKQGFEVNYQGIDSILLEIPDNAESIPLSSTNFSGVKIIVKNTQKDFVLFMMKNSLVDTIIGGEKLKKGTLLKPLSSHETSLLVIEDNNPWVKERKGFGHPVIRRDMLLVENGIIRNNPIKNYATISSEPIVKYCKVTNNSKVVRNLKFVRTKTSTKKTFLLRLENQYNVQLEDIESYTPDNNILFGDAIIAAINSCKIMFKNIKVVGSYSLENIYGYGIVLNNTYDVSFSHIYGHAKWGIFYVSNSQCINLSSCDLNRFDLHCYGRDFTLKDCKFTGRPNAYSSMYGKLIYDRCIFNDSDPIGLREDYNANTPFDAYFKNCTFNMTKNGCLMRFSKIPKESNERPELAYKCLPNLFIKNCKIYLGPNVSQWYFVVSLNNHHEGLFGYMTKYDINGLEIYGDKSFDIFSSPIGTDKPAKISIKNAYFYDNIGNKRKLMMKKATFGKNIRVNCNGKDVSQTVYVFGQKAEHVVTAGLLGSVIILIAAGAKQLFKGKRKKILYV